jgi:type IX secretion system PorP/SprF family membrane protein
MIRTRHIYLLFILLVLTCLPGKAVSDSASISLGYPVYSQYLQNGMIVNPAYAGSRGVLSGFLSYRMQWMGTKGSPVIQSVSLNTPLKNEKVGLGLMAQFMQYGFTKSTSIYGNYSYIIRMAKGKLAFGLKAGADISNSNYAGIILTNPGDPVFTVNEKPYILPNFGTGVYFYSDRVFAGFAVPSFLSYKKNGSNSVQAFHNFNDYDIVFTAGGLITFSRLVKLKPSTLIDYSMHSSRKLTQMDLNCNLILADLIWAGVSWRTSEEVAVGIIQVQLNQQLMLGFSYDYPTGRMNSFSKGSSEFILRYEFGSRISAANPRYF